MTIKLKIHDTIFLVNKLIVFSKTTIAIRVFFSHEMVFIKMYRFGLLNIDK